MSLLRYLLGRPLSSQEENKQRVGVFEGVAVFGARRARGVISAAGAGSRMQPLAFSKELLPVGSQLQDGQERPQAVGEYLVERMILGGATKVCFVISPAKTEILQYFGSRLWGADIAYVVQPAPGGLCDAVFRAIPLIGEEDQVIAGLPDTIWSPEDALRTLPHEKLSFLLFPVERLELFDTVVTEMDGRVREIQVKRAGATMQWIWAAFSVPGRVFHELYQLWGRPERGDEYFGTLGQRLDCGGRRSPGRSERSRLCRCGNTQRLPARHPTTSGQRWVRRNDTKRTGTGKGKQGWCLYSSLNSRRLK